MAGGPGSYIIGKEEKKELIEVIDSGYLFRYGDSEDKRFKHKVKDLESEFATYMKAKHCLATSSGTGSLLCCLRALDIGAGDEVIVPGYTFIASIATVMLSNATPVLAEIDESLTLDVVDVEKKITPKTKAIMAVHMLGNPCDMDKIMAIANKYNLYVIEDCCQAVGATYKGKKCGTIGDIGAYSLNIFKVITSGDGGAVITDNPDFYEKVFGYHDHGHKPSRMGVEVGNRSIIGMNLRMNELTGAVALAQIRKLDMILSTLRKNKERLKKQLISNDSYRFRILNDMKGECATLLAIILKTKEAAKKYAELTGTKSIASSGWHVYNNMEQILNGDTIKKNMLPKTDSILERAFNISIGVVDKGLGASIGININSTNKEIDETAKKINDVIKKIK